MARLQNIRMVLAYRYQRPQGTRQQSLEIIKVKNASLVTSGIYERYLQQGASVYHHIIDPKQAFQPKVT